MATIKRDQTTQKILEKQEKLKQEQAQRSFTLPRSMLVDVCFLMDVTGSMQKYVDSVSISLHEIAEQLDDIFGAGFSCLSFVGYRDFPKENPNVEQFEKTNFEQMTIDSYKTSDMYKKINNLKCTGGGDDAEDVRGAIKYAINQLDWQGKLKFILLIADAPAHGKEYNNGGDNYPSEDMLDALQLLKEKNIRLIFLKVGKDDQQARLDKMGNKIREQLKDMQIEEFLVEEKLGTAAKDLKALAKQLVSCMTDSIQRMVQQTIGKKKF